jgi:FkbM family methyltransferase
MQNFGVFGIFLFPHNLIEMVRLKRQPRMGQARSRVLPGVILVTVCLLVAFQFFSPSGYHDAGSILLSLPDTLVGSSSPLPSPLSSHTPPPLVPITVDMGLCKRTNCSSWKEIRDAWKTPEFLAAADEAEAQVANKPGDPGNQWARPNVSIGATDRITFKELVRDPTTDAFISNNLLQLGQGHDYPVVKVLYNFIKNAQTRRKTELSSTLRLPVVMDIGANIGYMTSVGLSLGARVISFEPMRANLGCLLATARINGWQNRSYVYHNAVSHEPAVVNMKSTNININLSNGHVTDAVCEAETGSSDGRYGVDWMEAVTIDQVIAEKHLQGEHLVDRIDLIKIDVERFEVNVIEGMIRTICHFKIDAIVMEILYIRDHKSCKEENMHQLLKELGFRAEWEDKDYTDKTIRDSPGDVVYVQNIEGVSPAKRLKDTENNPCKDVPAF